MSELVSDVVDLLGGPVSAARALVHCSVAQRVRTLVEATCTLESGAREST